MNNKIFVLGLIQIIIITLCYGISYTKAELSLPETISFTEISGSGAMTGWYGGVSQNVHTVYCSYNDRWYGVYPEYVGTSIQLHYCYSDSGDYLNWNDGGILPSGAWIALLSPTGGMGDYPFGSFCSLTYSNITGKLYCASVHGSTYNRVGIETGEIQGDGSVTWTVTYKVIADAVFNIDGYGAHVDITTDKVTGYPIICCSGYNTSASAFKTVIAYAYSESPENEEFYYSVIDNLPNGERYSSVVSTGENEVFIIEGCATELNKLYGGFINSSSLNPTVSGITDYNVKKWSDVNSYDFMDYSVSYNDLTVYICYTDESYNLRFFSVDIETGVFSSEELLFDGESSLSSFQPCLSVNDYTPSIFYFEHNSTYNLGYIIEKTPIGWSEKLNVFNIEYSTSQYNLLSSCRFSDTTNIIINRFGDNSMIGMAINFTGYGQEEPEEPSEPYTPPTIDWSGVKYILAFVVFLIIFSFAIYIKTGGKR